MAVVQPLEQTRNVNMEVEVIVVLGLADSLEVVNDILMNFGREWFRGFDLVVDRCMEVEDPSGSGDDLTIGGEVTMGMKGR